ncbi:MAG: carboxypeptidase-like regulatory domain-containing protein [Pirellulaceae bacterium]|nr:carboxypeptidase-like regulatory domain-containing protein [Pirellulaceae bacterium]
MNQYHALRATFVAALASISLLGCGGGGPDNLAGVKGRVTLDGQPLPNAVVIYTALTGGSSAADQTDENGNYELSFVRGIKGAQVGEYAVSISSFSHGDPDAIPPVPATPELVPERYNVQTELRQKVEPGTNTCNFDLLSGPAAPLRR